MRSCILAVLVPQDWVPTTLLVGRGEGQQPPLDGDVSSVSSQMDGRGENGSACCTSWWRDIPATSSSASDSILRLLLPPPPANAVVADAE